MKKLTALFLTLSLLLSLSGCALAEEPVRIVFWHSASEAAGALVEKYVKDFNDSIGKEKGIQVEAVFQGAYTDSVSKMRKPMDRKVIGIARNCRSVRICCVSPAKGGFWKVSGK